MGLLQRAVETYDANLELVGIYQEGGAPLAPIGHLVTKAQIELTIDISGRFIGGRRFEDKGISIIIPVTEDSAGRSGTSANEKPHPLCDQMKYLIAEENYYLPNLEAWEKSEYSHPFLRAIGDYLKKGTLQIDLQTSVDKLKENDMVCWRVIGLPNEEPACWRNLHLMSAFTDYYYSLVSKRERVLCMIDGSATAKASQHPKGIVAVNGNAKLISSNDTSGFSFRGRFDADWQAATVGYIASQKAHNALRWLASEQGVMDPVGTRLFLCWSPKGIPIPRPMRSLRKTETEPKTVPSDYRQSLAATLMSYRKDHQLTGTENVVLAAFDAATSGRLSLVYYNEFSISGFLDRMQVWDSYCCWNMGKFGIQAPNLRQLAVSAFGTQRGNFLEADETVERLQTQRLLDCKVNGGVFPADIKAALVQKASTPLAYEESSWRTIVKHACAAIQKYNYDMKQGGDEMSWELNRPDRSFQFGRLLAIMERAESDYYQKTNETRQSNAIKFMSEYRQRPWTVFERINRQLHQAYLNRIEPWQSSRYEKLKDEVCAILRVFPENELNQPLSEVYLMGYELQRNAFFAKNESENQNENGGN